MVRRKVLPRNFQAVMVLLSLTVLCSAGQVASADQARPATAAGSNSPQVCCDSLLRTVDHIGTLAQDMAANVDTLTTKATERPENYPITSPSSSIFFTLVFGILGILVGLLAILKSNERLFDAIQEYTDWTLFKIPVHYHFITLILLSAWLTAITMVYFLIGQPGGPFFQATMIAWVGSFIYLTMRIVYLTIVL